MADRPYRIPVLRGTVRKGARSAGVARWVASRLTEQPDVETRIIELETLSLPANNEGTSIRSQEFSDLVDQSDGLIIVSPEYNHGYPASLKHALDTNYTEYVHKPVGLVGVSTGALGGARMIENLLPVLRAVGLVLIQRDVTIGNVAGAFDDEEQHTDEGTVHRLDGMVRELLWMAATLRQGREAVPTRLEFATDTIACSDCGTPMSHHATLIDEEAGGFSARVHACPACGRSTAERGGIE
jgi:NAD(P)H-dependent FMN reductase